MFVIVPIPDIEYFVKTRIKMIIGKDRNLDSVKGFIRF